MNKFLPCLFLTCICVCMPAADVWEMLQRQQQKPWALSGPDSKKAGHGTNMAALLESDVLKKPAQPILVAVIDSGFDFKHKALKNIWFENEAEKKGQDGVDDDKNGFVDDVRGWNFIGGRDGAQVVHGRMELTREVKRLKQLIADGKGSDEDKKLLKTLQEKFVKQRTQRAMSGMRAFTMLGFYREAVRVATAKGVDPKDRNAVANMPVEGADEWMAREALLMMFQQPMNEEMLLKQLDQSTKATRVQFDENFSESAIIGDDPKKMDEVGYGNNNLNATRGHGTSVTSLIAAHGVGKKMRGQAPFGYVKVIPIRAVPDGDERDKDIANALRYAVDSGAKIVNMSFGKYYSPNKAYVDEAFKYAMDKGVLIIIAAGNDGNNVDKNPAFPNAVPDNAAERGLPEMFPNVLAVGASGPKADESLVAEWSNYGKKKVHVFAPGAFVTCADPGSAYGVSHGTSLAAPATTGVAAVLWSQFPDKTYQDIHDAIVKGARTYPRLKVAEPGEGNAVGLSDISVSGGIVDALRSFHYLKHGKLPVTNEKPRKKE